MNINQALEWLAEDVTRRMIVPVFKTRMRLRDEHPHIRNQFVPMPVKGTHGIRPTNIFIDEMAQADEDMLRNRPMSNDEIKVWLARPIVLEE